MMPAQPTLDEILAGYGRERDNLIPLLQEVQDRFQYLAPEAVQRVADHLDLSENDVYGVATFYAQFRFVPPGLHHVKVCQGTACHVRGSGMIMDAISRTIGIEPGQPRHAAVTRIVAARPDGSMPMITVTSVPA